MGKKRGAALRAMGLPSVAHLIHLLPHRYEHEAAEAAISDLRANEVVTARGEVTATRVAGRPPKSRFEAVLMDETGRLDLVWFNGGYLRSRIHPGSRIRVQGKSRKFGGGLQVTNPTWEPLADEANTEPKRRRERLRPVYPGTEDISPRVLDIVIQGILDPAIELIEDHLPEAHRKERALPSLREAYRMAHRPESLDEAAQAQRRLAYDELLLLQLGLQMKRAYMERSVRAPALHWSKQIDAHIRARLPFELTMGQDAAVREIARDLQKEQPANRLIQGDVGSGKTVVALYAMLMAAADRMQGAMMAPTELLAEQHFLTLAEMLAGSNVRIDLLTGAKRGEERAETLSRIESGETDIVVGTHALLTETVRFKDLAVVVIDEQHRFGVHQRAVLRQKTANGESGGGADGRDRAPHVLVMTATPIPRTLAMTIFGDLDITTIRGMLPGRKPIATRVVEPSQREEVFEFVRTRIDQGDQAYVVLPAIESGGALRDVRTTAKHLEERALSGKRIAVMHGKLKGATRDQIMGRFRSGLIDALVATTVIEVGVDVPNATVMVIDQAERFGLAQLHQLRGRVGRGQRASVCVLIGDPSSPEAAGRLGAMAETADGFELAERDLQLRGHGEILGARQSGAPMFRAVELPKHLELLELARRDARAWIDRSPTLSNDSESLLRTRLWKAHGDALGLADVA